MAGLDQARLLERLEPDREHVARGAGGARDAIEAPHPVEQLAQHHQRPPLADQLERGAPAGGLVEVTTPNDGDRTGRSHGDTEPQVTGDEAAWAPVHVRPVVRAP